MQPFRFLGIVIMIALPLTAAAEEPEQQTTATSPAASGAVVVAQVPTPRVSAPVKAPDPAPAEVELAATRAELEGVRDELQVLRDQWQRSLDRNVAQSTRSLTIGATAQTRFTQNVDNDKNPNSFAVPAILLNFRGNLRKDYEEGKNIEYALGFATQADFTPKPSDAFLSYSVFNSIDKEAPRLYVTAGQFKKPISLEAITTEEYKPTIRLAQFASAQGLDQRDIGVQLSGDLFPHNDYGFAYRVPLIAYSLALIDGAGPNRLDDNTHKDVAGRVVINAPVDYDSIFRGLSLGGSLYRGAASPTATLASQTTGGPTTTSSVTRQGAKNRVGVDLAYVNTPVGFTVEWARAEDYVKASDGVALDGVTTKPVSFKTVRSQGYAVTIFYNFGDQFVRSIQAQDRYDDWFPLTYQPFVRFDRFEADTKTRAYSDVYTIGFNWFFAQTTKLQINYNIKREHPVEIKNDEALAQFQFGF